MLGKRYSLGSVFEPTGEPLVKVANFKELAKQSKDIKAFLSTFHPDPEYMYLHVIALGAGEYWGKNINSDYFLEEDLLNRYKTFETDAHVYKEHDNKPYSQSYGYVPFAWYNMPMHRVELILAIDKIKGKEFVDRQNAGEQLCVSMGCRVKFDICSICGNHASKPNEYCEHIKYHKGEIFPDGKQAYMINPNPTFFDISIVRRPAWKPAFCLAKVASEDTNVSNMNIQEKNALAFEELDSLIPMEKTAEVWEIPEDDELLGAKVLAKHSSVQKVALDKQVPAISVQDIDAEIRDMLPAINKLEPDLPAPLLDELARKYDIKDILHSFASSAIPMKPQEFTRIVIVKNNLPLEAFGTVMTGILGSFHGNGKAGSGNTEVATPNILPGISRPEIMEKLAPFIHARSAILEDVLARLSKIFDTEELQKLGLSKTAAVLYRPNPVLDSLDLSPRMNFGYVRRVPEFQDINHGIDKDTVLLRDPLNLSTMPIALSRDSLAKELVNPSISDYSRNQLLALGALQGKDFSAFKDPRIINSVMHEPGFLSYLALLLSTFKSQKHKKEQIPLDTKSILNNVSLEHLTNAYNPVPRIISQEYYTRY